MRRRDVEIQPPDCKTTFWISRMRQNWAIFSEAARQQRLPVQNVQMKNAWWFTVASERFWKQFQPEKHCLLFHGGGKTRKYGPGPLSIVMPTLRVTHAFWAKEYSSVIIVSPDRSRCYQVSKTEPTCVSRVPACVPRHVPYPRITK
jgi:hypothetical protein